METIAMRWSLGALKPKLGLGPGSTFARHDVKCDGVWVKTDGLVHLGPTVAIVGARACSGYGRQIARKIGEEFAFRGFNVVSGLARGIDGEAHRGALQIPGGRTTAVLGCGVDRAYPAAHDELYRRIVEGGGTIVSEYPGDTPPAPWQFPARNRIIAALADAMVVVEANDRSGSLIAADFALEYGIPVFAVPGEITSTVSHGTNELLRRGVARIFTRVEDVLDVLAFPTIKED